MKRPEVYEKHIDEVIESNLRSNPHFASQLTSRLAGRLGTALQFSSLEIVRQSAHIGATGTIDLLVRLRNEEGETQSCLLIENKLDSSFTPTQPQRYASSAIAMTRDAKKAYAIICAPGEYLKKSRHLASFAAQLSYEEVLDWVSGLDHRTLRDAILRFAMPYEPDPVAEVADFHRGYAELVNELAPELAIKPNPNPDGERPEDSRTIYFVVQKTLPHYGFLPTLRFSHQCRDSSAPSASVKVMFAGWADRLASIEPIACRSLAGTQMYLRKAGRSLGLAIDTPHMDNKRPVRTQREAVEAGIYAAAALRAWMFGNQEALHDWAKAAGRP